MHFIVDLKWNFFAFRHYSLKFNNIRGIIQCFNEKFSILPRLLTCMYVSSPLTVISPSHFVAIPETFSNEIASSTRLWGGYSYSYIPSYCH